MILPIKKNLFLIYNVIYELNFIAIKVSISLNKTRSEITKNLWNYIQFFLAVLIYPPYDIIEHVKHSIIIIIIIIVLFYYTWLKIKCIIKNN